MHRVKPTPKLPLSAAPAVLHVDLGALAANYRSLQALAAGEVAGVVKANAYGLGVAAVARCLMTAGCRSFFVSSLAEGIELRSLEPEARVYVLEGTGSEPRRCRDERLVPVLNTLAEIDEWAQAGGGAPAALMLDTGMNRAGLDAGDVAALAQAPARLAALNIALLMTHLACADEPGHPLNQRQLERFAALRQLLPAVPTSIGNSAGALLGRDYHGDVVRPGIALYGGRPAVSGPNPMREVVRLEARVLQIRRIAPGTPVGYGASWSAAVPVRLATVGAGYADGYPRALGNRAFAIAAGQAVPVVGRVSMDLTTLDVSALPDGALAVRDHVQLIGGGMPLEAVAEAAGMVNYEILTGLSLRLPRRYEPAP